MQQNNKGNQLSTVLLLITLGFLIYYLTKPKPVMTNPSTPTLTSNGRVEKFAVDDSVVSAPTVLAAASAMTDAASSTTAPATSAPAPATSAPATSAPATSAPVSTPDFLGFSEDTSFGSDLSIAYDSPLPQKTGASSVDLNKNNVTKYDAKDFLPKEINDTWFDTDFSQAKNNVNDDKLINTERYVIGVNTVGQSLKNASYDIRGTVPNPKFTVSPWNNSTYEPDFNLKPLC